MVRPDQTDNLSHQTNTLSCNTNLEIIEIYFNFYTLELELVLHIIPLVGNI